MGCSNSTVDPQITILSQKINSAIQAKSTLQYQISQLKFLQDAKKAYPDIKEVKEAQIQNLKLSKEIKDTEALLSVIKENEMQNEDIKVLEETYQKLKSMLAERDEEIRILDEEVQYEAKTLEEYQDSLAKLNEDSEKIKSELEELMEGDKYKTIRALEETIEQLEIDLDHKTKDYRTSSPLLEEGAKSPRRGSITKVHQQLIMELKKKAELEDIFKELRSKAEGSKESNLGGEVKSEILRLDAEEKELMQMIEDAELRKSQLEKNQSELEDRLSPFGQRRDLETLEGRFDSSISALMSGVGDIRSEKEAINQENKKLKMEISGLLNNRRS